MLDEGYEVYIVDQWIVGRSSISGRAESWWFGVEKAEFRIPRGP